jgi:glycine/D-amino acid oxidase-like deaminating enzyme
MRVAVVGAGIMGAAAAWALARDGHEVRVLEQFDIDHRRGSSHGGSRIFRLAYLDPYWVALAREALDAWRALERETGDRLLELDGLLELASSDSLSSRGALEACGVGFEQVDPGRFGVAAPDGWSSLLQPDAGIVRADRARAALLRGVEVETRVRVRALHDVDADAVVVAAGPWARKLVPDLAVRETRETVAYFHHDPGVAALVERDDTGRLMYALRDGAGGLKAGAHMSGGPADPDEPGAADPDDVRTTTAWVAERFPGSDPEPFATDTCFYTTTVDESFVIERRGNVVVCSACSGHGFKFAPVVGGRVAELVREVG